jgi:hypothetical protein
MGKTQLALEYVYRHEREYGNVFWLDGDRQGLRSGYLNLAEHLGL